MLPIRNPFLPLPPFAASPNPNCSRPDAGALSLACCETQGDSTANKSAISTNSTRPFLRPIAVRLATYRCGNENKSDPELCVPKSLWGGIVLKVRSRRGPEDLEAHQRAHFGRMQALDRMLTRLGMAAVGFTVGASAVNSCIYDGILPILLQARWFLSSPPLDSKVKFPQTALGATLSIPLDDAPPPAAQWTVERWL